MTDTRSEKRVVLPVADDEQDRRPSIFRRVVVAIVRFVFSANGAQIAGGAAAAAGAYLLLPLAVWLIVAGVVFATLGVLREAGRI